MADDVELLDKPLTSKSPKMDDDTELMDKLIGDKDLKDLDEQDEKPTTKEEIDDLLVDDEEDLLKVADETDDLLGDEDTNARGLDLKKIKEKYPDFAKTNEFKELRNAYHRESKYTELFPTIEDAQEAAENNETFNKINASLVEYGDPTILLTAIKDVSPESFKKVSTSFLDTLAKLDDKLYVETITPVVKRLAKQIYNSGKKTLSRNPDSDDGKALVATARNIMQYAFEDDSDIEKNETPVDNKISEKEQELQTREARIAQEKYIGAYQVADTSVERHLDKLILQGLDPDNKFNDFTRDSLLEKIKTEVKNQISRDESHLKRMNSLWKRAANLGYSRESLSSIVSAYLERARPIIPTVRSKFRSKAIGKSSSSDENEDENKSIKLVNRGRTGRSPSNDGKINLKAVDTKKIDYRKTSDEDIFDGKVKLRG